MQNAANLKHNEMYQAMINWRSVRRYDQQSLSERVLDKIQAESREIEGLVTQNRFSMPVRDVVTGDDLVAALGAYGRVLSPPHFLVPYLVGNTHVLTDLAYRTHQVVVKMASKGLGCCYIGSLGRETTIRARFVLRRQARVGAIVIFGYPTKALTGQTFNKAMRRAMGSHTRKPLAEIFFQNNFRRPQAPPKWLRPLLEAGRRAPSALNVQPCRYLLRRKTLYLFVEKENAKYGKGIKQNYRLYDAGISMANIMMTLRAMSLPVRWNLLDTLGQEGIPRHPETLEPVASLVLPTL
jgi:nitroreductase